MFERFGRIRNVDEAKKISAFSVEFTLCRRKSDATFVWVECRLDDKVESLRLAVCLSHCSSVYTISVWKVIRSLCPDDWATLVVSTLFLECCRKHQSQAHISTCLWYTFVCRGFGEGKAFSRVAPRRESDWIIDQHASDSCLPSRWTLLRWEREWQKKIVESARVEPFR